MGKRKNSTNAERTKLLKDAERTKLLKELGYTEEDMQRFWDECVEINHRAISALAKAGLNWTDLCIHQISQLPDLKDSTLKARQEKAEKEAKEKAEKERIEEEKAYYEEHFEEILVKKIDAGESLTESELSDMRDFSIERDYGENRRWQRSVYDICMMCGRYFALTWEEGLTESQENEFFEQPYEVFKTTKIVVEKKDEFVESKEVEGVSYTGIVVENKFKKLLSSNSYKYRGIQQPSKI